MPFVSGSVGCVVYRVAPPTDDSFHQQADKRLRRYAFRPIGDRAGVDMAMGWVHPLALLDSDLRLERLLFGEYLYLGLRIDKKTPNRAVLNARVREKTAARLRDQNRKRIGADERQAIIAETRNELLAETSPTTAAHEALWNVEAGWLFFSSASVTVNNAFLDIFADTFDIDLEPLLPATYAQVWAESQGLGGAFEASTAARFGASPAMAPALDDWDRPQGQGE